MVDVNTLPAVNRLLDRGWFCSRLVLRGIWSAIVHLIYYYEFNSEKDRVGISACEVMVLPRIHTWLTRRGGRRSWEL